MGPTITNTISSGYPYRKRILNGKLKDYLEAHLFDIQAYHPDVEIERYSIQVDHLHLVIVIPPRYAVSELVGKIKANTSRLLRRQFPWVRQTYRKAVFWSPGFFSSTVGVNEEVIMRYVAFQEKMDKGQLQRGASAKRGQIGDLPSPSQNHKKDLNLYFSYI